MSDPLFSLEFTLASIDFCAIAPNRPCKPLSRKNFSTSEKSLDRVYTKPERSRDRIVMFTSEDILKDILDNTKQVSLLLMKVTTSLPIALQAARFLKLAGMAMILISLLDFILLPIPLDSGVEWALKITTQMVDRGIVPMLGMALIFSGYAFEHLTGKSDVKPKPGLDLKFWVFLISSILGLVFLGVAPIHMSNVVKARNQTIEQINQEAKDAEQQLEIRLEQQATQLQDLLANQQNLDNYVSQGDLSADELARLQTFKDDPDALNLQMATVRSNLQKQIDARRAKAENKSKIGTLKSLWRVGISCLLLASCYLTIGWTGFKSRSPKRKTRRSI